VRPKLPALILAVVALGARTGAQASRPQAPPPAAISGVVTDGATDQPVAGAFVEITRTDAGKTTSQRVNTDTKGRFVLTELEPGAGYSMTAGGVGYMTMPYGWEPGAAEYPRNLFTLAAGEWKRDLSLRVWRRAVIGGRVTDERGEPVIGVAVRGYSVQMIAGLPRTVATALIATTDDRGIYRLDNLEPGQYKIAVMSVQSTVPAGTPEGPQARPIGGLWTGGVGMGAGSIAASPLVDGRGAHRLAITNFATPPPPADGRMRAYPPVFYPGVLSLNDADPIAVKFGDERGEINFQLRPIPSFVVSGRLEGSLPAPILLRLLPAGFEHLGFGSEVATTMSEKDGAFTFLNVPAGIYTLIGQASLLEFATHPSRDIRMPDAPGFPSGTNGVGSWPGTPTVGFHRRYGTPSPSFVRRPIAVSDDMSNLVLPLSSTSSIRGRIVHADGSLAPTGTSFMSVSLMPADGDPSLGNPDGRVEPSLSFAIDGVLPGRYRLVTSRVISSIVIGGRDMTDAGLDVAAGQVIDDVVITVTGKPAQIKATVSGLAPEMRAAVIVFPASRDGWTHYGWNPARIASLTTDVNGAVDFARLPAGEYYVVAVEPSKTHAWTDPHFLAAAAPVATRVTVALGESKTVMLNVKRVVAR